MRNGARVVGLLLVLLALSMASVARAQGSDPAAAETLFREGRSAMKAGDFKVACPKFVESHRLDPAPGTAVNIGDCLEKLGKLADALQAYRDALDLMRRGDDRIAPVKAQISALEKRVPRLTITLAAGATAGTKVLRDDVELEDASIGAAFPVNPGEHVVEVVAPGHEPRKHVAKLGEGEARELEVEAGPPTADTGEAYVSQTSGATEPAPERSPSGTARTAGFISLGIGAAGLVGWGVAEAALASRCPDLTCPADVDLHARRIVISTLFAVGVVGAGVGAYLIVSSGGESDAKETAVVRPIVGSHGAAVSFTRTF